jgi:hypothetical protein
VPKKDPKHFPPVFFKSAPESMFTRSFSAIVPSAAAIAKADERGIDNQTTPTDLGKPS